MIQSLDVLFQRIPVIPLFFAFLGYFAWDYYQFVNSPDSELNGRRKNLAQAQISLTNSKQKLATAEDFFKNLDSIRARIVALSKQLEETKSSLNSDIDIGNFIRMITMEAKKIGLNIKSIKPEANKKADFYLEVPFNIAVRGAYVQILVFFDRIVRLSQIVRVAKFEFKPLGNTLSKYVELEGQGTLFTYKYVGTSADDVIHQDWMKGNDEGLKRIQELKVRKK